MTKVLIISSKSDLTSDFVVKRLWESNVAFYRFNTEELTHTVNISLDFHLDSYSLVDTATNQNFDLREFSAVYFRRPEVPSLNFQGLDAGETRFLKNEVLFLLEGIYKVLRNAYWISPLYAIREAENKVYQLLVAKSLGFEIPESLISNSYGISKSFYEKHDENCILKPIKSGLLDDDGSRAIFTNKLTSFPDSEEMFGSFPSFIQRNIEKECDVRVICVGSKAFGTLIDSQSHASTKIDWRKGETALNHIEFEIPIALSQKCTSLLKLLGLRFGAIDFILDKSGHYIFLEINPNGQWGWIEKMTSHPISTEIANLLINEDF